MKSAAAAAAMKAKFDLHMSKAEGEAETMKVWIG
jgi:hypothetical protein